MEWINNLQGEIVGLDTAPLIYFIEENPVYIDTIKPFFEAMDKGEFLVVTSTQISAALEAGATYFLTNDIRLPDISSLQILSVDALG